MTSSASASPVEMLSTRLCPWLRPTFDQLVAARAAGRLGHAWLLTGPRGVGKINLALAFAASLVARGARPLGELGPADAVAAYRGRHEPADRHPDIHWLFPEEGKRTIAVDQIRGIIDQLELTSHAGVAKVAIIEPADGMTDAASNALLKTLEQPAGDAFLILLSARPGQLLATIRSRCQRLSLAKPSGELLRRWLGARDEAAFASAWQAAGGAPIPMAAALEDSNSQKNKGLYADLAALSEGKTDAQSLADRWTKSGVEQALAEIVARLHREIRARAAPGGGSTSITDPADQILHNAWASLSVRSLFEQYDATERLLNLLGSGSGINMELALHALLLKLQPSRGRP